MNERRSLLNTARALQCPSYLDEHLLVIWHRGANEVAIRGPLGEWRGLRVPEGRGGPRFAKREPFPSRRAGEKPAPTAAPGPGRAHSPAPVGHSVISDPQGRGNA
jgi:hypothetical protein